MKKWIQPLATVEYFVANEYVAACWSIHCDVPYPDEGDGKQGFDPFNPGDTSLLHRSDHCGDDDGFKVDVNEDGVPTKLTHTKPGGSTGECTLWPDANYEKGGVPLDITTVNSGDTIYFTTTSGSKTWHHHGTLNGTNHS